MGLQNLDENAQERWRNLVQPERLIKSTRFCDLQTLRNIGLEESVRTLMRKVGLEGFLEEETIEQEKRLYFSTFTINHIL